MAAAFDEADARFFDQESDSLTPTAVALAGASATEDEGSPLLDADRPAWRDSPRRRAFMRWVGVVVAVSLAVCVVAFTRVARVDSVAPSSTRAAPSPVAHAPFLTTPPLVPAPPIEPSVAVAPASPEAAAADPRAAREARESARRALERGALERARAEGIRSIELDPTDAESWLVLGASEMEAGNHAEARATFLACTNLATRGPRGECAAMVR